MHFHLSTVTIFWTLTLAALLALLAVLLVRHRAHRFPWFTTLMAMMALRYLSSRLLYHRVSPDVSDNIFLGMADVAAVVALLVAVEVARRAFAGAGRREWIAGTLALLAVGGVVVAVWSPWPPLKTLFPASGHWAFPLMSLFADKSLVLFNALFVQLGLLVLVFGRKFKPGWRSRAQKLAIGFALGGFGQLAVERTALYLDTNATTLTSDAYKNAIEFQNSLMTANSIILLVVLVWWTVCFWRDEPGT